MTFEEKKERIKDLRPIDDVCFEVLVRNKAVCQEILQTILEDPKLIVEDVIPQDSERNIYGRSVRLDALCITGSGKKINIEVQRADNDDHFRRVRYNESVITARDSNPGERFENIPDLWVVYISEFDFIGDGCTKYHVRKAIMGTGKPADDGIREIYVNTAVKDGTDTSELMSCFLQSTVNSPKFPRLSEEMYNIKDTEGGADSMCAVVQKYVNEGLQKARQEGRLEGRLETVWGMIKDGTITNIVAAAKRCGMTKEEFLKTKPDDIVLPAEAK